MSGWGKAYTHVVTDPRLSAEHVRLYVLLTGYVDGHTRMADPGPHNTTLAAQLGIEPQQVKRLKRRLKACGYLATEPRMRPNGKGRTSDAIRLLDSPTNVPSEGTVVTRTNVPSEGTVESPTKVPSEGRTTVPSEGPAIRNRPMNRKNPSSASLNGSRSSVVEGSLPPVVDQPQVVGAAARESGEEASRQERRAKLGEIRTALVLLDAFGLREGVGKNLRAEVARCLAEGLTVGQLEDHLARGLAGEVPRTQGLLVKHLRTAHQTPTPPPYREVAAAMARL